MYINSSLLVPSWAICILCLSCIAFGAEVTCGELSTLEAINTLLYRTRDPRATSEVHIKGKSGQTTAACTGQTTTACTGQSILRDMALACSKHGADVPYYCETCSEYMCSKCLASGDHSGHKFTPLRDLFEREHENMLDVQKQTEEAMRVITALTAKLNDEDVRLEQSYQQTRGQVDNFFQSVRDMVKDRERALLDAVESEQSDLVGKLEWYHSELEAAEKCCQHWLGRQREVIEKLRKKEVSAAGEYNECIAGLDQAEKRVKKLVSELANSNILCSPPVIGFTCSSQIDQLKEAIKCLGQFDATTAATFEDPSKVAYLDHNTNAAPSNESPGYSELNCKPGEETDYPLRPRAQTMPDNTQYAHGYRTISTDKVTPLREYDQPEGAPFNFRPRANACTTAVYQPDTPINPTFTPDLVISHLDMKDVTERGSVQPTRAGISNEFVVVTESGAIRCVQDGKLHKKITKVGGTKLTQLEGVTYYAQKGKFLVVDANSKKLIKVKPDVGKVKAIDLPKISSPNEVTIDTGSSPIVYVTDPPSMAIFKYNTSGKLLGTIDLQSKGLQRPAGIAYADGYLLIVDLGGHCIFKLDPEGMFVGKIGSYGDQLGCLNQPYGIAVLPNGLFAVTEMGNHRVSVFNTEGQFETCFGNKGREPGMFTTPKGISANSSHLVVVDYGNKRLQVFEIQKIDIYEKIIAAAPDAALINQMVYESVYPPALN